MSEYTGITQERFNQLGAGGEEVRKEAAEEIWAELLRTQGMLNEIRTVVYRFLDFRMPSESQGDRDAKEHESYLASLRSFHWGMTE